MKFRSELFSFEIYYQLGFYETRRWRKKKAPRSTMKRVTRSLFQKARVEIEIVVQEGFLEKEEKNLSNFAVLLGLSLKNVEI